MGTYTNPVIPGFHPDPSICRVGDDFYLATSSFTYFPGVPIFHSTDLVRWMQIGNALERPSQLDLSGSEESASKGIFAPTLRHHDGRFWMITTNASRRYDNFFVTAEDPAGPWSEPVPVHVRGIDPDLAWDDEGRCWVHSAALRIFRARIDDATGEVLEDQVETWSGTGLQYPEAPHLIRRGAWWYLLIAEGGTERGHAVSIARGSGPEGPWEPCPANPVLSHRSTHWPIQNTGHADLVEAADGSWWMVLLGTRPRGPSPLFHVLGRETFLAPVDWVDDWPVPHRLRPEMAWAGDDTRASWAVVDEFDGRGELGPEWLSVRRSLEASASLVDRPGSLRLEGGAATLDDPFPTFVGRRQQELRCRARATVSSGSAAEAGLAVRMDERHHVEVAIADGEIVARARIGPLAQILGSRQGLPSDGGSVVLRIETHDDPSRSAPDVLHLGWEREDGSFDVLAELDGRYLSTEVAGGMVGRVIGLYAVGGVAFFERFSMEGLD